MFGECPHMNRRNLLRIGWRPLFNPPRIRTDHRNFPIGQPTRGGHANARFTAAVLFIVDHP